MYNFNNECIDWFTVGIYDDWNMTALIKLVMFQVTLYTR